jgi:hypothetical protein
MLKDKPNTQIATIDFLDVAARPAIPNEPQKAKHAIFVMFVKSLLQHGAPESVIKNKTLMYPAQKMSVQKWPRIK